MLKIDICIFLLGTVKSWFKKDIKLQIHIHKAFFSEDWFLDSLHKSFLNQATLNSRKEKWTFLNREFTVQNFKKLNNQKYIIWRCLPGTFHILIGTSSYFVIRFLNQICFVINFSYFIVRFLLNSSIVKSDNKIGKVNYKKNMIKKSDNEIGNFSY